MSKPDFLETAELSEQQVLDMMNLAVALKACARADYDPPLLKGRTVALLLDGAETPFRAACEAAVVRLGGMCQHLSVPLETKEHLREAARFLDRIFDCAVVRFPKHETLLTLAKLCEIPLVNGGTAFEEPVQEIADIMTMYEHLPAEKKLEKCKAVFAGPAGGSCNSALFASSKIGMQFMQLCAEKAQELQPPVLKLAERNVKKSGGAYAVTDSAEDAYQDADFLFMDAPLTQKLPPEAAGVLRIDKSENWLSAMRAVLTCTLYENPALREPMLIEKMKRMLTIKLQAVFGYGEATE